MSAAGADKPFEAGDPLELIGMTYPVSPQLDSDREMARTFAEEFALMGWPRDRVRLLFETPHYAGPYAIRRRRGEHFVTEVLTRVFGEEEP